MNHRMIIQFLVVITCLAGFKGAFAAEANYVDLLEGNNRENALVKQCDLTLPEARKEHEIKGKIKATSIHGVTFSGEVVFLERDPVLTSLWGDQAALSPTEADTLFKKISEDISGRLKRGDLVQDVPSYDDNAELRTRAMLWQSGGDVILLELYQYPTRAGVSITRQRHDAWIESMGADEGVFWSKTLKRIRKDSPQADLLDDASTSGGGAPHSSQVDDRKIQQVNETSEREHAGESGWACIMWLLIAIAAAAIIYIVINWRKGDNS